MDEAKRIEEHQVEETRCSGWGVELEYGFRLPDIWPLASMQACLSVSLCGLQRATGSSPPFSPPHVLLSSSLHLHYDKHASELRLASLSLSCPPPYCWVTAGQSRTTEPDTRRGYRHGDYNDHHRGQKPH